MATAAFLTEMARLQDSHPITKVEFVSVLGVTTDISSYYQSGAQFQQVKERAPDEIQAGNFDLVLFNHDNYFSEYDPASLIYNSQYHGAKIKLWQGFVLPDGTTEYAIQAVGFIDELVTTPDSSDSASTVTIRCRDRIRTLLDQKLNPRPFALFPVANTSNTGNGSIASVETKPFKTKNETWTITCTLGGTDGVATFSVVGSTSGNVGTATSGTQFSTGTGAGGVKFTIAAGATNWVVGDIFTFTTKQHPEWSAVNAGKIIWAVLTGYNWDTNTQEAWSDRVLSFDHTQSTANTDIDYTAMALLITNLQSIGTFTLTGYVAYDEDCVDFLQQLTMLFLGSIFTAADGRLTMNSYIPTFAAVALATFGDTQKITMLGYNRTIDEVINHVVVNYKGTSVWEFSDETVNLDGTYAYSNSTSITKYGTLEQDYSTRWYATSGAHVIDFTAKLLSKYSDPPLNINFSTGADALLTTIGDPVAVTDSKYNLSAIDGEVAMINKQLDQWPITIQMRVRRDADLNQNFGFIGSSADEGDGISPQADTFDTASASDKSFAYFSKVGSSTPDYRVF